MRILKVNEKLSKNTLKETFRSHIGCSFEVCADAWSRMVARDSLPQDAKPKHLIWTLMYLKLYDTQRRSSVVLNSDSKTIRKWKCIILKALFDIKDTVVRRRLSVDFVAKCQLTRLSRSFLRTALSTESQETQFLSLWIARIWRSMKKAIQPNVLLPQVK